MGIPQRHLVEMDALLDKGFDGWWELMQYTVGWFTWEGIDVLLIVPALWDSAHLGKVGIVQAAPRRDQHRLKVFFEQFDLVAAILLELRHMSSTHTHQTHHACRAQSHAPCARTHTTNSPSAAVDTPQQTSSPWHALAFPAVIMTRLKDNLHIVMCCIQDVM